MLTFVGLGLYNEESITIAGKNAIQTADHVFAEFYTSTLTGTTVEDLEEYHNVEIVVRDREGVEQDPGEMLDLATEGKVCFLTAGDPMVSTTHTDLRLRAAERDIETQIIHGQSAQAASCGLTGLQNYRFGKATTLPFPDTTDREVPSSVIETIEANKARNLHTLVYLDIDAKDDRYLSGPKAATMLEPHLEDGLGVIVARAGSADPVVVADTLENLSDYDIGGPLHILIIPGLLHHIEAQALKMFGDAPPELIDQYED
ncbi:MAG: diphthine synthase [Halobacteriaceae archaeon]